MKLGNIFIIAAYLEYCTRTPSFIKAKSFVPVFGDSGVLYALENIRIFLERNQISKPTQNSISSFMDSLNEKYSEDENPSLKRSDAVELQDIAKLWFDRVQSEISEIVVFRAYTEGRLNPKKLCDGAKTFFQPKVWKKLPKIVKEDLEETAKCLLTQSWTASGLMSMRALESGVRKYYTEITGNSGDDKTFGQMTSELRNNQDADSKLIGYLDYLKDTRNDLAHPNIRINQFEAEQAFQHTIQILTIVFG